MLNALLNEMDGLKEDADILFVLTTNRPEQLESALAGRPGRIDQAIEVPLPNDIGRDKLVRLYGTGLPLGDAVVSAGRATDRRRQCRIHQGADATRGTGQHRTGWRQQPLNQPITAKRWTICCSRAASSTSSYWAERARSAADDCHLRAANCARSLKSGTMAHFDGLLQ